MRNLLSIPVIIMLLVFTACSGDDDKKPAYNKTETMALINEYDASGGKLQPVQYSMLIKNTRLLFADIKETMKALLSVSEPLRFAQEYQKLKNNDEFIDKLAVREKAWRVLVLGQKGFSKENMTEFGNLPDECMLIDYYDDCIRVRVIDAAHPSEPEPEV